MKQYYLDSTGHWHTQEVDDEVPVPLRTPPAKLICEALSPTCGCGRFTKGVSDDGCCPEGTTIGTAAAGTK